jgi:hypothetical protein
MAMGTPETPGHANDNLLLKQIASESLHHLALLIASDVTCKLLEGQLNRWLFHLFTPWKKWKYVAGVWGDPRLV